jgi:transaldolase
MLQPSDLRVQIFADGADLHGILNLYRNPLIQGFTTNPTLMRKAGIDNYEAFARKLLAAVPDRPLSLEVFADDLDEMERQAREIASFCDEVGGMVNVKIPVTNTKGVSTAPIITRLARAGVRLNVTALMTLDQVRAVIDCIAPARATSYISVFAGRVADTGRDPVPIMAEAVRIMAPYSNLALIWASPRELLNIFQADQIGCHVITVTHDVLQKLSLVGKNLEQYSLETVQMFFNDATKAGFTLPIRDTVMS